MGKPTGFLEIDRHDRSYEKAAERVKNFKEFTKPLPTAELTGQAARCMDCGIPFCHNGCPVNNMIPDWNNLVYRDQFQDALTVLHSTNNFPEFTGRICPAPCEASCTLNIDDTPVTIKTIECAIVDRGWEEGWIVPQIPAHKTGKRVAVVGSGPAGLACAQQLARAGHAVTLFEKADRIGGLLRYGIPDFKMEKHHIDRRMAQMEAEGVAFRTNIEVGASVTVDSLLADFDAVALTGGAEWPRDLAIPNRALDGIHYAMDFLTQQNKRGAGDDEAKASGNHPISAKGKHVVVIGGGDTGSDCIGTSARQGAASITQIEIMPKPPEKENKAMVWPDWPNKLRSSHAHEEGVARDWSVQTKDAIGENGRVTALDCAYIDWVKGADGRMQMVEVAGSGFQLKADLVLLAMGFLGPRRNALLDQAGVELDQRGNVAANTVEYRTSRDKLFAAGDMRRGQSLVVWAIREGRQCARAVDKYLMGRQFSRAEQVVRWLNGFDRCSGGQEATMAHFTRHPVFRVLLLVVILATGAPSPGLPPVPAWSPEALSGLRFKAVLIAGDRHTQVFDHATKVMRDLLVARQVSPADIQRLSAAPAVIARRGVRASGLAHVLAAIERMHPASGEGCLVFATSHGTFEEGLYLAQSDNFLTPAALDEALARGCGNAPTVVIISGCFSGTFTRPPMTRANRVILTAAREDRPSFGCGAGFQFTVYDRCLLRAMGTAATWPAAYDLIRSCVSERENALRFQPSEPRAFFGEAVASMPLPRAATSGR